MDNDNKLNIKTILFYLSCISFSGFLGYNGYQTILSEKYIVASMLLACAVFFFFLPVKTFLTSKKHLEQIKAAFNFDPLTRLPTSTRFKELVQEKIEQTDSSEQKRFYLIKIGFDRFRNIQDNYGFSSAEQVILDIRDRLVEELDDPEVEMSRLEGEGFLIFTKRSESTILNYVRKINSIFNEPFIIEENNDEIFVSAKMGIAYWGENFEEDYDKILKQANFAYLHTINNGNNEFYKVYNSTLRKEDKENVQLETLLRSAIEKDEIMVHFQPKVSLDGRVRSAEALARWYSKEKGHYIRPDIFINTAEDIGIIEEIGQHIMELSVQELAKWQKEGYKDMKVAVNVSAKQFNRELPKFISSMIDKYNIKPETLEVEVTESALVDNKDLAVDLLFKIKDLGVNIAIDDFGTGYSSLSYLVDFPLDVVKIDKSFIDKINEKEIETKNKGEAVVSTVIHLSHKLGCIVVAEGVEYKEQLDFLKEENCDLIQGYYFSKPLNKNDFFEYLVDNRKIK